MTDKLVIKALGQTIEHNGEVILVSKGMPRNCMVLFIDMNTWENLKETIVVIDD